MQRRTCRPSGISSGAAGALVLALAAACAVGPPTGTGDVVRAPSGDACTGEAEAAELVGTPACLEEVRFTSGELTLAGRWFAPRGAARVPAVVLIRGSGPSTRGNVWAETFAAVLIGEGVGVLIPDKRGSDGSEGDWRTAEFSDLADDALAGLRHLASRADVRSDRIGLMGLSQGGMIAPVAAARTDSVAFVINVVGSGIPLLESVRFEMLHTFREEGLGGERLERAMEMVDTASGFILGRVSWEVYLAELEESRPLLGERITDEYFMASPEHWRWDFFRRLADFDSVEWWRRVEQPALVLLGGEDANTPTPESARRLRAAFAETGHPDATVVVFEGLGHALWSHAGPMAEHGLDPEVRDTLASWVRRVAGAH